MKAALSTRLGVVTVCGQVWILASAGSASAQCDFVKLPSLMDAGNPTLSGPVVIDGDTCLTANPNPFTEETYIYEFDGASWVKEATLQPAGGTVGMSDAVTLDGDRVLLGQGLATAVSVFEKGPSGWVESATLSSPAGVQFGGSVSLGDPSLSLPVGSNFGSTVALGSEWALVQQDGSNADPGAVYAFRKTESGWVETEKIVPVLSTNLAAADRP